MNKLSRLRTNRNFHFIGYFHYRELLFKLSGRRTVFRGCSATSEETCDRHSSREDAEVAGFLRLWNSVSLCQDLDYIFTADLVTSSSPCFSISLIYTVPITIIRVPVSTVWAPHSTIVGHKLTFPTIIAAAVWISCHD